VVSCKEFMGFHLDDNTVLTDTLPLLNSSSGRRRFLFQMKSLTIVQLYRHQKNGVSRDVTKVVVALTKDCNRDEDVEGLL